MTPRNDSDNGKRNTNAEAYIESVEGDGVGRDKHDNSIKNWIFKVFNLTKWSSVHLSFFTVHQQFNTKPQAKKISGNKENKIPETNAEQQEANNANDYKTQGVAVTTNRQGRISILLIMFVSLFTFFSYEYLKDKQEQRLQKWSKNALQEFKKGEQLNALKSAVKAGKKLNNPLLKKPFHRNYLTTTPIFALQQIVEQFESSIEELNISQHPLWTIDFDGEKIVTGGWEQKVYLCYVSSLKNQECICDFSVEQKCEFDVEHTVTSISFIPNSNEFAVATQDGRILISENMKIKNSLKNKSNKLRESAILSLSYNSNRKEIAAGRWNGNVTLHDLKLNKIRSITDINSSNSPIRKVSYDPNNSKVAAASEDGKIYLIDLTKPSPDFEPVHIDNDEGEDNDRRILSLDFSPDSEILAVAGEDGLVRLLKTSDIEKNQDKPLAEWDAEQGWVTSVIFADERSVIATAGWNGTVKLWDYSGNQLAEWNLKRSITSLDFDSKENILVAAKLDGTVSYWEIKTLPELINTGNKIIEKLDNE